MRIRINTLSYNNNSNNKDNKNYKTARTTIKLQQQ